MQHHSLSELRDLDKSFHLHPFTNNIALAAQGTYIIRSGKGCRVIDEQGRSLLDGLAGLWCVNIGYGREEIIEAIHKQLEELAFYPSFFNSTTEPTILLAAKLAELTPKGVSHAMFCNSGSEANESALKIIRAYNKIKGRPQKHKIITRTWAYHGVGVASTSLTAIASCTDPFDLPLPGFIRVPGPYAYGAGKDNDPVAYGDWCIEETEKTIQKEGPDTVAALFAEPIQGAGGVIVPPPGYLKKLRELCRRYDILFIADEVITGFGRLGAWFGSTLWDLSPDMMTMAKGLTNGYIPLGATMVSDEIVATLNQGGYWAHGFTYSGHPVATTAALATIGLIERDKLLERVKSDIGPYFEQKLGSLRDHPAVGEVRSCGMLGAIELLPKGGRAALTPTLNLGVKMFELVRQQGVIARGIRNLMAVSPALIVTRDEVDELVGGIRKGLDRLWD